MAFSIFLRRGASSAAPLLLRSLSLSACAAGTRPLSLLRQPPPPLSLRGALLSSLARPSTDASLVRVIESEIRCAEECDDHERVEEVPEGFPFEIEDERGMNVVRLRRSYQGREQIEVVVSMPSLVTGDEDPNAPEEEGEEGDTQVQAQSHIPITVRVSKDQAGPTLEFACTAYPDEVVIDSLSVTESPSMVDGEEGNVIAYEGPDFNDLDENLQKAFHKYLELRGITPLTTNFLHEYMINKDSREYLLWLRNLKAFILK